MEDLLLQLKLFAVLSALSQLSYVSANITTSYDGRPCPGEVVTLTCTVAEPRLSWYTSDDKNFNLIRLSSTRNQTAMEQGYKFSTVITPTTLMIIISRVAEDGLSATCRVNGSITIGTVTVQLADSPSPPVNVSHSVQSSTTDEAVVSVQWDPPDNNGGRDDLNYTVNISPPTTQLSATVVTSTTVTVTVAYNKNYTISIEATNCAGNSTTMYMFTVVREVLCGLPQSPVNGSLGSHFPTSPLGTTVTFQCDDGLFPTDVRTSTCRDMSGRGEWEPNPAQLVCSDTETTGTSFMLSIGGAVGITAVTSALIGLMVGMLLLYFIMCTCANNNKTNPPQEQPPPPGPVYEEVSTPKENIELATNQAYGPVGHQTRS